MLSAHWGPGCDPCPALSTWLVPRMGWGTRGDAMQGGCHGCVLTSGSQGPWPRLYVLSVRARARLAGGGPPRCACLGGLPDFCRWVWVARAEGTPAGAGVRPGRTDRKQGGGGTRARGGGSALVCRGHADLGMENWPTNKTEVLLERGTDAGPQCTDVTGGPRWLMGQERQDGSGSPGWAPTSPPTSPWSGSPPAWALAVTGPQGPLLGTPPWA